MDMTNVSMDEEAIHEESGKPAKHVFCNNWDNARIGLEAIRTIVKNPIVKVIVGMVITLGDSAKSKFCS